jgi:hypothetical protein
MNGRRTRIAAAVVAVGIVSGVAPPGRATVDPALNGEYTATSDGQWAKTNEIFHDEVTVVSTWTITSSCTNAYSCTGTVTSDHGWTAEAKYTSQMWFVTRILDGWETCADGASAPGNQIIKFYESRYHRGQYEGWDTTVGPSGACGINRPLFIELPFTLVPK